jgi:hypothetical protein
VKFIATFAEFLAATARERDPVSDVPRAWAVYNEAVYAQVQDMLHDPFIVASRWQGGLSEELAKGFLESIFGPEWVQERFAAADEREPGWLRFAHQRRELARRVFEFQSHPWFADFVDYTRTNEVASALFEADVLQTLMRMPASVGRVTETKVKGQDYDALIHLGEVGNVPIEVKYKKDDTPYSASTIHSTLKAAARQLPKGQVGWLFLHIPTAWVGPQLEAEYADILHEALRQTSRVAAVFTAIDKPHVDGIRGTAGVRRVWQFWGHEKASEAMWDACLLLKELLDAELALFAPHAPF